MVEGERSRWRSARKARKGGRKKRTLENRGAEKRTRGDRSTGEEGKAGAADSGGMARRAPAQRAGGRNQAAAGGARWQAARRA